jgi:hypothetical protein
MTGAQLLFAIEKWVLDVSLAVLFCLNYYILVVRRFGTNYEREFSLLGKRERTWISVVAGATIALIIGFLIFSSIAAPRHQLQ